MMHKESYHTTMRPELNQFPNIALPFYPRSAGHFTRRRGRDFFPPRHFVQICWGISGEVEYEIDGHISTLREENVLCLMPEDPHIVNFRSEISELRWITFDGKGAKEFIQSFGYPRTCFLAGPCPHELFLEYENLMLERTPSAWRKMVAVITQIIAAAGTTGNNEDLDSRLLKSAIKFCQKNYHSSEFNINSLADLLGIDRSSILRLFRKKMDISPLEYLSQLRLQRALSLLVSTRRTLKEIAEDSGFSDVNYFCRFIKQKTGKRPSELR